MCCNGQHQVRLDTQRWKYPRFWGKECFIREYVRLCGFCLFEFITIKRMRQNRTLKMATILHKQL